MKTYRSPLAISLSLIACSSGPDDGGGTTSTDQTTSMDGSGSSSSSGGASLGSGGAAVGSGGMAGPSSGGVTGSTGGAPASGGGPASTGGDTGTGSSDGSGGESTASGGGSGDGELPEVKSGGCGKANPMTGSSGSPLNVSGHNYYVKLPAGYNPDTAYKTIIVFPPTGNPITWSEQSAGYEQAAPDAIRVYTHMSNQSSGWQPNETSFFQGLWDNITSSYCIDENRVFGAGESSGGEFVAYLGCEYGDLLRGVAPGAPKGTSWQINLGAHDCKGNPTAIVIWSPMDNVLTNPVGPQFRDFYKEKNMCGSTDTPVEGYTDNKSNCKMFEDCLPGSSVYHCQHSDPTYMNSYHGWAAFAGKMTWEVFSEL